jgi:hypothetical protein
MTCRSDIALLVCLVPIVACACGGSSTRKPSDRLPTDGGEAAAAGSASAGTGGLTGGGGAGGQEPPDDEVACGSGPRIECSSHSACGADMACLCRPGNETSCVPANCRTDEDCLGQACRETTTGTCPASSLVVGMYCTTTSDECDPRSPATDGCANLEACRYSLDRGAYVCHPLCTL